MRAPESMHWPFGAARSRRLLTGWRAVRVRSAAVTRVSPWRRPIEEFPGATALEDLDTLPGDALPRLLARALVLRAASCAARDTAASLAAHSVAYLWLLPPRDAERRALAAALQAMAVRPVAWLVVARALREACN
ncbi:MAG: hypothetical protein ACRELD_16205, partial [Longimicrobiales bacterium]